MRCRTAQYAIHLDREGECSPRLRKRAIAHASACARCAEELRRVEASAEPLARIRIAVPQLSDPLLLTGAIMREVERARTHERQISLLHSLPLLPSPRFRILLQSAAWTIAFFFTGQTLLDADSMSRLDERFDLEASARVRDLKPGEYSPLVDPLLANTFTAIGPAGLESVLGLLGTIPPPPPPELARILAKYPGLSKITLGDGLDERERQVLLTEGPRLVKDLERLIMEGRNRQ